MPPETPPDQTARAAGLILVYATLIGFTDNFVREIAADHGLWQFHALRSAMVLGLVAVAVAALRRPVRPRRWGGVAARSAIHGAAMLIYFGALAFLPVAVVAAGLFTAPIFVLLIGRVAYGHRIGPVAALAVALGFAGVVMVLGPEALRGASLAALLPVLAGLLYAIGNIATREWCAGESALTLATGFFAMMGLMGAAGLAALAIWPLPAPPGPDGFIPRGWVTTTPGFLGLVLMQAVGSLVGVACAVRAYQVAAANRVAVMEYVILPASALWGWAIWDEVPTLLALAGMAMIAAAGVLIAVQSPTAARQ